MAKLSGYLRHRWETTEMDCSLPGGTSTTSHRIWQQIIMDPSHERYTPRQRPGTAAFCLLRKRHARKHNIHGLHVRSYDTKVYRNIKTYIDREVPQSDLSRLEDWSGAGNGSYASTLTSVKCYTSDEITSTIISLFMIDPVGPMI